MKQAARYIPAGARAVQSKKAPAVAYIYERGSKFIVVAYAFNQSKPQFHFSYRSAEERAKKIGLFFKGVECAVAYKAERAAAQRASRSNAGIKVGQVFYSSWGYEQSNVNFYEVVELVGKASAKVRAIRSMECSGNWGESYGDRGYCEPSDSPDRASGEAFLVQVSGSSIRSEKLAGRGGASKWDGKPCYWSSYA